tara:strand:+ start:783 stop:1577 length:795 start_codon:yes stop_codon:yes gene_type:complete
MYKFLGFITFLFFSILFYSCSDYQKLLNNGSTIEKNNAANKLYESGDYRKALNLYVQLVNEFKGKPQHQRLVFFLADCYFQTRDYYLASYQYENFIKSYPKSNRVIEATYMQAKSQYMLSPRFSLDQTETYRAIDLLQIFIDKYPNSEYTPEVNSFIQQLQEKLEKKNFEISKQYFTIRDFRAAINSIDNFIADNPGTIYREEALYYKFLSSYEIAINSIVQKKNQRLKSTEKIYFNILKYYPESIFKEDLDKKIKIVNNELYN